MSLTEKYSRLASRASRLLISPAFSFLVLTLVLAASALIPAAWLEAHVPPLCPSRVLLGLDCPGCGMTRAFTCLGHGDWRGAWGYNAWSLPFFLFVLWQWGLLGWGLWREKRPHRPVQ